MATHQVMLAAEGEAIGLLFNLWYFSHLFEGNAYVVSLPYSLVNREGGIFCGVGG